MKAIIYLCRCIFFCILLQTITGTYVFAQSEKADTIDNDTYGPGGNKITRIYTDEKGNKSTFITIKDAKKRIREYHSTVVVSKGKAQYDAFFDSINIDPIHAKEVEYDQLGNETKFTETRFKNGKLIYGFRWHLDENGIKHTEVHDGKDWIEKKGDVSLPETQPDANTVGIQPSPDQLFAGFAIIREDSKPGFFTYGGEVQFSHSIFQNFGLIGDLGYSVGSSEQVDYTKKAALAGAVTWLSKAVETDKEQPKVDVSVHLLGGISSITSSYSFSSQTFKYTSNYFTLDLGIGAGVPLNTDGSVMLGGNLDYLPTISSTVKSNVRLSVGLKFGFGSKRHGGKVKTPTTNPKRITIN